jgi:hypothetical protein
MGSLVTEYDIAYIKSTYPLLDIKPISPQYEQALMYYLRGHTPAQAARAAGMNTTARFSAYVASEEGKALLSVLRDREFEDVRITRGQLTSMFMEAYHVAATATEMVAAARELGKLHGIYPDSRPQVNVNIDNRGGNSEVTITTRQMQKMSDAELLQFVPTLAEALEAPVPIASPDDIEGEVEHVGTE